MSGGIRAADKERKEREISQVAGDEGWECQGKQITEIRKPRLWK